MTDKEAYIAFNLTERIGSVGVGAMLAKGMSVAEAWESYPCRLSRAGGEVNVASELEKAEKYGVEIFTPADEGYPAQLLARRGHPLALYVKGDVKALSLPSVAIVGTRRATAYGLDRAAATAENLAASGICIVSGLALGIDAEAHRGALAGGGAMVGVIGSGLDEFYPRENRGLAREIAAKGGAVISEFPFGRPPDQKTFPQRNRIVAGLSRGVLVVESRLSGGSLITAGDAAEMGVPVMALPGRVDSPSSAGCLKLIRDGARLVRDARDILEEIGSLFPDVPVPDTAAPPRRRGRQDVSPLSPAETAVLDCIDREGVCMDGIVRATGLSAAAVNAAAMSLRLKGQARFLPGNILALPRED